MVVDRNKEDNERSPENATNIGKHILDISQPRKKKHRITQKQIGLPVILMLENGIRKKGK